jgi:hypothetical protein
MSYQNYLNSDYVEEEDIYFDQDQPNRVPASYGAGHGYDDPYYADEIGAYMRFFHIFESLNPEKRIHLHLHQRDACLCHPNSRDTSPKR